MANEHAMSTSKQQELIAKSSEVFSPAAPINRRDLFAGRLDQLQRVFDAIHTRGQHAVIFGERGVGKTSLANIVEDILSGDYSIERNARVVKVNCSKDDTYATIWKKAFAEICVQQDTGKTTVGYFPIQTSDDFPLAELLPDEPSPHDVKKIAQMVGTSIIILDEFDRVGDSTGRMADSIKTLSDASIDCTLVLVGVAHDIDELIKEHASIDRSLVQISMPRMTTNELHEILKKALAALDMQMAAEALDLIVLLSQGLPHYTHVLGKASVIMALRASRWNVTVADVRASIKSAIDNTQQSIRNVYQFATASPRQDTLFKQVLLACALAEVDSLGFFASSDVRAPLSAIMGKPYDIPNFSQHLDKFSSSDRGNVLEKAGTQRRFRFRFTNPLLQPFVIMCGIADSMLEGDLMRFLQRKGRPLES